MIDSEVSFNNSQKRSTQNRPLFVFNPNRRIANVIIYEIAVMLFLLEKQFPELEFLNGKYDLESPKEQEKIHKFLIEKMHVTDQDLSSLEEGEVYGIEAACETLLTKTEEVRSLKEQPDDIDEVFSVISEEVCEICDGELDNLSSVEALDQNVLRDLLKKKYMRAR